MIIYQKFTEVFEEKNIFYNVGPFKIHYSLLTLITILSICKLQTLKYSSENFFLIFSSCHSLL